MSIENEYCFGWFVDKKIQSDLGRAALLREAKWKPGEVITVTFLDGDQSLWKRIQKIAETWTVQGGGPANLSFEFRWDITDALIRVSFKYKGSWSAIGTTC